jgi:hypothetical protein
MIEYEEIDDRTKNTINTILERNGISRKRRQNPCCTRNGGDILTQRKDC